MDFENLNVWIGCFLFLFLFFYGACRVSNAVSFVIVLWNRLQSDLMALMVRTLSLNLNLSIIEMGFSFVIGKEHKVFQKFSFLQPNAIFELTIWFR